jgi:hypothetical protein
MSNDTLGKDFDQLMEEFHCLTGLRTEAVSKKVDKDTWEYKGKKGKWRTTGKGDRVFFPSGGGPPMAVSNPSYKEPSGDSKAKKGEGGAPDKTPPGAAKTAKRALKKYKKGHKKLLKDLEDIKSGKRKVPAKTPKKKKEKQAPAATGAPEGRSVNRTGLAKLVHGVADVINTIMADFGKAVDKSPADVDKHTNAFKKNWDKKAAPTLKRMGLDPDKYVPKKAPKKAKPKTNPLVLPSPQKEERIMKEQSDSPIFNLCRDIDETLGLKFDEDRWSDITKELGPGKKVAKKATKASSFWAGLEIKSLSSGEKKAMEKMFKKLTKGPAQKVDPKVIAATVKKIQIRKHPKDPSRATLKIPGTGDKQRKGLVALANALGVKEPEIVVGKAKTMTFVPKTSIPALKMLQKAKTEALEEALAGTNEEDKGTEESAPKEQKPSIEALDTTYAKRALEMVTGD